MSTSGSNALQVVGEAKPGAEELVMKIPRLKDRLTQELVIALVGPVGSGCTTTYQTLRSVLETDYSYAVHYYKLSEFISESAKLVDAKIGENVTAAERVGQPKATWTVWRRTRWHAGLSVYGPFRLDKPCIPLRLIRKCGRWLPKPWCSRSRCKSTTLRVALGKGAVPEVELVDELPDYLKTENFSFKDFAGGIEQSDELKRREERSYFNVVGFDKETRVLTLKTETLPRESGTLILSLAGETTQIKRRMAARQAILEGRAANPQLGLLIEEQGQIARTREPQKTPPLTAFVRKKVFRNDPTVMQEKAIEVALNTPDIALIQGPPGTGKTTVIAAILERLNEIADKRGTRIKGQILLTGFQHDAVENMIERLSLNGMGLEIQSRIFIALIQKYSIQRLTPAGGLFMLDVLLQ